MPHQISDHFDGTVFYNPEPTIRAQGKRRGGFLSMLRMRLSKDPAVWSPWPERVHNAAHPAPDGDDPSITFIGHVTFLIRLPGLTILTDPVFSARCSPSQTLGPKRVRPPGIALADLPPIDLILLSHNHYDHMDLPSLRALRRHSPHAALVTTLGNAAYLAKKRLPGAVELDWWQSHEIGAARITATPARHFSARSFWDRNKTLWAGFMLEHQGRKIYFAGDTGFTRAFSEIKSRLGPPDLALLPIGAYEPRWFMAPVHMNPSDAVTAFLALDARRALGMHFGTFQLTAEAIDAPLRALSAAIAAANLPPGVFTTLEVGATEPL
jgi:L-ascorbate metabolism protein UlaG (beta-lactamase superfamily)